MGRGQGTQDHYKDQAVMKTKTCWICKKEKPLDAFYNDKRRDDGKRKYCKQCADIAEKYRSFSKMELACLFDALQRKYKVCVKSLVNVQLANKG